MKWDRVEQPKLPLGTTFDCMNTKLSADLPGLLLFINEVNEVIATIPCRSKFNKTTDRASGSFTSNLWFTQQTVTDVTWHFRVNALSLSLPFTDAPWEDLTKYSRVSHCFDGKMDFQQHQQLFPFGISVKQRCPHLLFTASTAAAVTAGARTVSRSVMYVEAGVNESKGSVHIVLGEMKPGVYSSCVRLYKLTCMSTSDWDILV